MGVVVPHVRVSQSWAGEAEAFLCRGGVSRVLWHPAASPLSIMLLDGFIDAAHSLANPCSMS